MALVFSFSAAQAQLPGEIDPTFNAIDQGGGFGANGVITASALQPDGKLLIAGDFTKYFGKTAVRVARLNPDGTLDDTFNPGLGPNNVVNAVQDQPDGKVLIGGFFTSVNGVSSRYIARLNADGTFDTSFSIPGNGLNGGVKDVAVQPDGKIIVAGNMSWYDTVPVTNLIRLNTDGSLDNTFNNANGPDNFVRKMLLLPDGKLMLIGAFYSVNGLARPDIARVHANGTIDSAFNAGTGPTSGTGSELYAVAVQPDGKILAGGMFWDFNGQTATGLMRLHADGTRDLSLQNNINLNTGGNIRSIVVQPDGKIVIGGSFQYFNVNRILRLEATGAVDNTFTPGLGVSFTQNTNYPAVTKLLLQPDGKLVIAGNFLTYDDVRYNRLVRINSNGTPEQSFITGFGAASSQAVALQPDGKVVIAVWSNQYNGNIRRSTARIHANGSLDTTFITGSANTMGTNFSISALLVLADGKIMVGGDFYTYNGMVRPGLACLNSDGSLSATFANSPFTPSTNFAVQTLAQQPDGKVIIGGRFESFMGTPRNRIARLNANGTLDATFNPGTGANNMVLKTLLQPDGKILILGRFTLYNGSPRNQIARLNSDGTLDATFNPGAGPNNDAENFYLQPDGKIVVVGYFTSFDGAARNRIVRLNADGSVDTGFNPGTGANQVVSEVTGQADGKLLIAGSFSSYNGTPRPGYVRLNGNGTLDASFVSVPGLGIDDWVLDADENLIIVGGFGEYLNPGKNGVARLFGGNSSPASLSMGIISGSTFCQGTQITIPFVTTGSFSTSNIITVQLSDANGSFASPLNIGETTAYTSGSVTATIPAAVAPGNGYRIRLTASNPAITITDNGTDLTITAQPVISILASANQICLGGPVTFTASGATNYSWQSGNGLAAQNVASVTAQPTTTGNQTYTVTGTDNSCATLATTTVSVLPAVQVTASGAPDSVAPGQLVVLNVANASSGLTYSWFGPQLNQPTGNAVTASPTATGTLLYTVIASNGACADTAIVQVYCDNALLVQQAGWDWVTTGGGSNGRYQQGAVNYASGGKPQLPGDETGVDISVNAAGLISILGTFKGTAEFGGATLTSQGPEDIMLITTDDSGQIQWVKRVGSADTETPRAVSTDNAGNAFICGNYSGTIYFGSSSLVATGAESSFLAKYAPWGEVLWTQNAAGAGSVIITDVAANAQGNNITVTGYFSGSLVLGNTTLISNGGSDIFVATYNAAGAVQWAKKFGANGNDAGYQLAKDAQGNTYLTGTLQGTVTFGNTTLTSPASSISQFYCKLDASGNAMWAKVTGTAASAGDACEIAADANGNAYLAGTFTGSATFGNVTLTSFGNSDVYVLYFDANGNQIWAKRAGGAGADVAKGIAVDAQGLAYITGSYTGYASFGGKGLSEIGSTDIFVAKYDMAGNCMWARKAGGIAEDAAYAVSIDAAGNSYTTGYFSAHANFETQVVTATGQQDLFIAKLNHIPAVGIEEFLIEATDQLLVFPNPFTAGFSVALASPVTGQVEMILYDLPGKPVYKYSQFIDADESLVQLTLPAVLPQGMYVLWVRHGNTTSTVRLVKQ